ncbi:MAG: hypothetical protein LBP31_01780 [Holosporales bacterium]|nr:hypothetical protein [Holosporales bacterium]
MKINKQIIKNENANINVGFQQNSEKLISLKKSNMNLFYEQQLIWLIIAKFSR